MTFFSYFSRPWKHRVVYEKSRETSPLIFAEEEEVGEKKKKEMFHRNGNNLPFSFPVKRETYVRIYLAATMDFLD